MDYQTEELFQLAKHLAASCVAEVIGPDQAAEYLDKQDEATSNRPRRANHVLDFQRLMIAKQFILSIDLVAFDEQGLLCNGQHRLQAVVASGLPQVFLVMRGVTREMKRLLDQQSPRTVRDIMQIDGIKIANIEGKIARMMHAGFGAKTLPRTVTAEYLKEHHDAIKFALETTNNKVVKRVTLAAVLAPIARAAYTEDWDRLRAFGAILIGAMPGIGDEGAHLLVRFLVGRGTDDQQYIYARAERALQAFLNRERITKLFPVDHELWPLADELPWPLPIQSADESAQVRANHGTRPK